MEPPAASDHNPSRTVADEAVLMDFRVRDGSEAPPCPDRIRLVKREGQFHLANGTRLENNLFAIVGFMELANAGDFAANVWNDVPVPIYAIVFMAIGGTVALILSVFAFCDLRLAWRNICFLRQLRLTQKAERTRRAQNSKLTLDLDVLLAVTFRELGGEFINRWCMDLLMGGGAILIAVGTYMAIGGANRTVWEVSNILSGYLGNAPIAVFGLVNSSWALYVCIKAQHHIKFASKALCGSRASTLVRKRNRNVQTFYAVNGSAAILGGVSSMLTATRWWAYVMLIPVIISSLFCNFWWRKRVGYSRSESRLGYFPHLRLRPLISDLEKAAEAAKTIAEHQEDPIKQFVSDPSSLADLLNFLQRQSLMESYALKVASNPLLVDLFGGNQATEIYIGIEELLAAPSSHQPLLLQLAHECVQEAGPQHFVNRERFLAELLGVYCSIAGASDLDEKAI